MTFNTDKQGISGGVPLQRGTGKRFTGYGVQPHVEGNASRAHRTITADEAALLLHIHPQTLKTRARTGLIPGCKVGKVWVFVESLLIEYLVAQSLARVSVADTPEKFECRSTEGKIRLTGGLNYRLSEGNEVRYRQALGLPTSVKPNRSTTSSRFRGGSKTSSVPSLAELGKKLR